MPPPGEAPQPAVPPDAPPAVPQSAADVSLDWRQEEAQELKDLSVEQQERVRGIGDAFAASHANVVRETFEDMAKNVAPRLRISPEYVRLTDWVRGKMEINSRGFYRYIRTTLVRDLKGIAQTSNVEQARTAKYQEAENRLHDYVSYVKLLADLCKMEKSALSTNPSQEALDTKELARLGGYVGAMAQMCMPENGAEMVDFLNNNLEFVVMIAEGRNIGGQVPESLQKGQDKVERNGKVRVVKKFDKHNPKYRQNLEHLHDFILGKSIEGKQAGPARQQVESFLWKEIIGTLPFEAKADLIVMFIKQDGPDRAKTLIEKCISLNVMTRDEIETMYRRHCVGKSEKELDDMGREFKKLAESEAKLTEFLKGVVQRKDAAAAALEQAAERVENPRIQSAAQHFLTLPEMLAAVGILAAKFSMLATLSQNIMTRISARKEKGENWLEALGKGVLGGVKDKYFLGAAAVAIGLSEAIYPWMKRKLYSPDAQEAEKVSQYEGEQFLRDQAANHRPVVEYFLDNYDRFADIANNNKMPAAEKTDQSRVRSDEAYKNRNKRDLYPGDVVVSEEMARDAGYSQEEAVRVVHWLFNITRRAGKSDTAQNPVVVGVVPGLDTKARLFNWLEQNVWHSS